jgi:thiamine-phosphate pyrophosphorylase
MSRRHLALPRVWMLTDERQGESLWPAIERLPRGVGVVVRHYSLSPANREELARALVRRGLTVAFSGPEPVARRAGAHAVYGAGRGRWLPRLYPVHNGREVARAERAGAALLLVSPVFVTRSHPGARGLGLQKFSQLARASRTPVIALGGMTPKRFQRLRGLGADGWAAIDWWTCRDQTACNAEADRVSSLIPPKGQRAQNLIAVPI